MSIAKCSFNSYWVVCGWGCAYFWVNNYSMTKAELEHENKELKKRIIQLEFALRKAKKREVVYIQTSYEMASW